MNAFSAEINPPSGSTGTLAPIKNISLCLKVANQIVNRPPGVDGLGMFYGPSGYGKSRASQFVQNKTGAIYLEVFEFWTRKVFVQSLLLELGVDRPVGTIASMMLDALRRLQDEPNRLLIIDEADKIVDKGFIELVRDIYKGAKIPVLLVGEEALPQKLARYERCENRVTAYGMANPCDVDDARVLATLYHPGLTVEDDLLEHVVQQTKGVASRIVTTLAQIAESAKTQRLNSIGLETYDGPVFTGQPPRRRVL